MTDKSRTFARLFTYLLLTMVLFVAAFAVWNAVSSTDEYALAAGPKKLTLYDSDGTKIADHLPNSGADISKELEAPQKNGYFFIGWYDKLNGFFTDKKMTDYNLDLYAIWAEIVVPEDMQYGNFAGYSLVYEGNIDWFASSGSAVPSDTATVKYNFENGTDDDYWGYDGYVFVVGKNYKVIFHSNVPNVGSEQSISFNIEQYKYTILGGQLETWKKQGKLFNATKVYGDADEIIYFEYSPFAPENTTYYKEYQFVCTRASGEDAGKYGITEVVCEDSDNIEVTFGGESDIYEITKKEIKLTSAQIEGFEVDYGDGLDGKLTQVIDTGLSTPYVSQLKVIYSVAAGTTRAGSYPLSGVSIAGDAEGKDNFEVSLSEAAKSVDKLTINKKALALTTEDIGGSAEYTASMPDTSYTRTVTGVGGQSVKLNVTIDSAAIASAGYAAGTYDVTNVAFATSGESNNYTLQYETARKNAFSITPKQLTATDPTFEHSKVYDGTTNVVIGNQGVLQGVLQGDEVTMSVSITFDSPDVAAENKKTLHIVYSISGAAASNYIAPIGRDEKGTISPAVLTVAVADMFLNDGDAIPAYSADDYVITYDGFVNGESVADLLNVVSVVKYRVKGDTTGTFADLPDTLPAGEYSIRAEGAMAVNYDIEYVEATLTIQRTSLAKGGITISGSIPPGMDVKVTGLSADDLKNYTASLTGGFSLDAIFGGEKIAAGYRITVTDNGTASKLTEGYKLSINVPAEIRNKVVGMVAIRSNGAVVRVRLADNNYNEIKNGGRITLDSTDGVIGYGFLVADNTYLFIFIGVVVLLLAGIAVVVVIVIKRQKETKALRERAAASQAERAKTESASAVVARSSESAPATVVTDSDTGESEVAQPVTEESEVQSAVTDNAPDEATQDEETVSSDVTTEEATQRDDQVVAADETPVENADETANQNAEKDPLQAAVDMGALNDEDELDFDLTEYVNAQAEEDARRAEEERLERERQEEERLRLEQEAAEEEAREAAARAAAEQEAACGYAPAPTSSGDDWFVMEDEEEETPAATTQGVTEPTVVQSGMTPEQVQQMMQGMMQGMMEGIRESIRESITPINNQPIEKEKPESTEPTESATDTTATVTETVDATPVQPTPVQPEPVVEEVQPDPTEETVQPKYNLFDIRTNDQAEEKALQDELAMVQMEMMAETTAADAKYFIEKTSKGKSSVYVIKQTSKRGKLYFISKEFSSRAACVKMATSLPELLSDNTLRFVKDANGYHFIVGTGANQIKGIPCKSERLAKENLAIVKTIAKRVEIIMPD